METRNSLGVLFCRSSQPRSYGVVFTHHPPKIFLNLKNLLKTPCFEYTHHGILRAMATTTWDNPFGDEAGRASWEEAEAPLDFDLESYPVVPPHSEERTFSSLPALAEPWPSGLVFDLALGIDSTQTILDRYAISPEDYEQFMAIPAFRRELAETMRKNQEEGISFSRKMANIAEECIPTIYNIIKNPLVPASTRGDLWKHTAKLGKLEPTTKEAPASNAPTVNIQINL